MWSNLSLVALVLMANVVVDAQLFPGTGCSICSTTLPEVGLPDVVLEEGFAGVLTEDQTCAETEELAQSGAYSRASCVLLRTSGISTLCGCQAVDQPIPPPIPAPVRAPVPVPAPVRAPVPVLEPTDAPEPEPTDAPEPEPTDVPVPVPTESPVAVVVPTESPVAVAVPTEAPVAVIVPTEAPVTVTVPTEAPVPVAVPTTAVPTESPIPGGVVPPTTLAPSGVNATLAPSVMVPSSSMAPTMAKVPSMTQPPVMLTGAAAQVVIRLTSTNGPLSESATLTFLNVCTEFYNEFLPELAMNVTCSIPSRRLEEERKSYHLRAAQVLAPLDVTTNVMAYFDPAAGVIDFADAVVSSFNENADTFVSRLRTQGAVDSQVYFTSLKEAAAFEPTSVTPIAPPLGSSPSAPAPVPVPTPSATGPVVVENESSNGLSAGAIVGIVAGVLVGIALLGGGISYSMRANPNPAVRAVHTDPVGEDFPSPNAKPTTASAVATSYAKEPAPVRPAATPAVTTAAVATAAAATASVVTRDNDANKDGMSVMTGSEMDAYSLDAGNVDQPSSAPGTKRDTADGMSQSGDEMSSHAMSSLRQNMVSRTVVAPPGKLGIVIDTTLEGPVVHKINPQSPLEGTLFPGDIIVAIDDVDTRAMSASAITALMVRTANLRRKLTVLSEDVTN